MVIRKATMEDVDSLKSIMIMKKDVSIFPELLS